ncbi:hypothetical protein [Schlesneria paludicola]|uniref:hypothetical protein n=1 Tax=Schlesneria paludicola TaxID=360056 RepID=UPI000299E50C|nr:hypothetical protein [Schlesneria paludicola]
MFSPVKFSEAVIPILMTSAGLDRPFRTGTARIASMEGTNVYHSTASDPGHASSLVTPLHAEAMSNDDSAICSHTTAIHIEVVGDGDLRVWATDDE